MGRWIAEIDQHAVAHVFRHEAAEASDRFCHAFLISADHLAQVFRVHPRGELGRSDKINKHHRHLTTFSGFGRDGVLIQRNRG